MRSSSAVGSEQTLRLTPGRAQRPAAVGLTFTVLRAVVARAVVVTSPHRPSDVILESADGQPAATAAADGFPVTSETDSSDVTLPLSPLLLLPAGFLGRLRLRRTGQTAPECRLTEVPAPAEVQVTALITPDGRHVKPGLEPLCWPLALVFTVHGTTLRHGWSNFNVMSCRIHKCECVPVLQA